MNSFPALAYLVAHPESVSLTLSQPMWLLALLGLGWFIWLAPRVVGRQRLALVLRLIAFTLVILALAGIAVRVSLPSDRLSVVAVVDRSDSIDTVGRRWEERYVDQLASALAPDDELGVVTFARDAVVVHAPGASERFTIGGVPGSAAATDIAQGLDTALALFPAERERRIVLLSDGNETRGDSQARVARAKAANVTVYAAIPPRATGSDAVVDKLGVPPVVAEGMVFPIRVVVHNQGPVQSARVNLFVDGKSIGEEAVSLKTGLNSLEIPYRLTAAGSHRLRAEVALKDDVVPGNNFREASIMVSGKTRVLLVTQRNRSPLALALDRKGMAVSLVKPADLAGQLGGLSSYHCVVFEEVPAATVPPAALDAIERYVRDGGGFVLAAGDRTYGDAAYKRTALARLLPVTLEARRPPRPEREPLALYLIIDRSNSMGYHIHNRMERSSTESKLEYAKRAALAVVGQLRDSDLVGVIVFDTQMYEVSPLRPLKENRGVLERDIPRLVPGGGTDFLASLETARKQLVAAGPGLSHIMLLTDGDTNASAREHYPTIEALAKAHVSVTAIRVGDDAVNLQLLNDIASRTGGAFYHVENAETLPQLMLKDASRALAHAPRQDESFAARVDAESQVLRGIKAKSLPELHGYAYAKPKPDADVLMTVASRDKQDPLLSVWQYGLGRVVAFTAGLGDDAETWVGWDGFGKLWSQIVHWAVREQTPWDFGFDVQRVDGQSTLVVQAFGDLGDATLLARLQDGESNVDVELAARGARTYTGPLPSLPGGRYPLTLLVRRAGREIEQHSTSVVVPAQDAEPQAEYEASGPNRGLLEALTGATGGAIDAPISSVVGRQLGTRHVDQPLDWLLLPLAMLCLLGDVAARRLSGQAHWEQPETEPAAGQSAT